MHRMMAGLQTTGVQCNDFCTFTVAEGSSATPDERVVQRRALLQRLGLSTSHYLKLQTPHRPWQATQVALQPLLNTAAICLMPDQLAYHWWQAPAAAKQQQPSDKQSAAVKQIHTAALQPVATGTVTAEAPQAEITQSQSTGTANAGAPNAENLQSHRGSIGSRVPGQVEVEAIPSPILIPSPAEPPQSERASLLPGIVSKAAASGSAGTASSTQQRASIAEGNPSGSSSSDAGAKQGDGSPFECSPVHVQLQVLNSLRRLLTVKLDAIAGGSAQEDRVVGQQAGCSHAACMALEYRAGQKEIAAAALDSLRHKTSDVITSAAARLPDACRQAPSLSGQQSWAQLVSAT